VADVVFRVVRNVFAMGQRPNAAHVLVLMTDGVSNNRNETWYEARRTRRSGIDIIAVNKTTYYTPCLRKNKQNYFRYNYVKLPPNLLIFGTKMANSLKLYEVHSFSTSPNLCYCSTVLNADVLNCYITLYRPIRLLIFASSIRQKAPHDLIILWFKC